MVFQKILWDPSFDKNLYSVSCNFSPKSVVMLNDTYYYPCLPNSLT